MNSRARSPTPPRLSHRVTHAHKTTTPHCASAGVSSGASPAGKGSRLRQRRGPKSRAVVSQRPGSSCGHTAAGLTGTQQRATPAPGPVFQKAAGTYTSTSRSRHTQNLLDNQSVPDDTVSSSSNSVCKPACFTQLNHISIGSECTLS